MFSFFQCQELNTSTAENAMFLDVLLVDAKEKTGEMSTVIRTVEIKIRRAICINMPRSAGVKRQ